MFIDVFYCKLFSSELYDQWCKNIFYYNIGIHFYHFYGSSNWTKLDYYFILLLTSCTQTNQNLV